MEVAVTIATELELLALGVGEAWRERGTTEKIGGRVLPGSRVLPAPLLSATTMVLVTPPGRWAIPLGTTMASFVTSVGRLALMDNSRRSETATTSEAGGQAPRWTSMLRLVGQVTIEQVERWGSCILRPV